MREIVRSNAPTATLQLSQQSGQRDAIENLLVILAEARQASISPETLKLFSSQLAKYHVDDIRVAVSELSLLRRKEGETAFPDLATIDDAVWEAKNRRLRTEREARERAEAETEERARREHPENYVHVRDVWAEFIAKRGIEAVAKPLPAKGVCQHCNGVQLSALTAVDLRALADAIEKQEKAYAQKEGTESTEAT